MITAASEREVPLPVALRLFVSGAANQWSWLVLGVSIAVFWFVLGQVDFSGIYYFGQVEQVKGVITNSQDTNFTINDQTVMMNFYRSTTSDGQVIEDFSYATGRWHTDGTAVTIEYPAGKPHLSRIQGMRREKLSPLAGMLISLLPLGAFLFVGLRIRKGRRHHALLKHGRLAKSQLVKKVPTNMSINDEPVYKLTFEFTADDGQQYEVAVKAHDTKVLEDDDEERLLYDPDQPKIAALVDTLQGQPSLDEHGNVKWQPASVGSCVIPALAIVGNGVYLMIALLLAVF